MDRRENSMSRRTRFLLLIGILLLATFLRFYHLKSLPPGLFQDEAMDGNNAVEVVETGKFQSFYPEDDGREGLYVNLIAIFLKHWPIHEPWVIRLPATVAGVLTVPAVYFLGAELFGYEIGLLAAFLFATSVWHIIFSRIGFRAILAPLFLTWACYFLIKSLKATSARVWWPYSIMAGAVFALGFYTYIAYRVTPLVILLLIFPFRTAVDLWKKILVFAAAATAVAGPIAWHFLTHPADFFERTSQISVTASQTPAHDLIHNLIKTALMLNVYGDYNWRHNVSGAPELFVPVGILFLLGLVVGGYRLWQRWRGQVVSAPPVATIFGWIVIVLLPVVFSDEGIPHALRSILLIPPVMMVSALGGIKLYRWGKSRRPLLADGMAIAFLVIVAVFGYYDYFDFWARNPNVAAAFNVDYVKIGKEINSLPPAAPKFVVVAAAGGMAHGLPIPAEPVMFLTNSFTPKDQQSRHITYLAPEQANTIPANTPCREVFYVTNAPSIENPRVSQAAAGIGQQHSVP